MRKIKLTKKDLESLIEFNRTRIRIGEPKLNQQQYLEYLYGKKVKVKQTISKLKSFDIPVWANDPRVYKSGFTDHIAGKKNEQYKQEVSKQYPVALAYNKGNYQVLLPSEIPHAGRKV